MEDFKNFNEEVENDIILDDGSVSISNVPLISVIEKNLFLTILIKWT